MHTFIAVFWRVLYPSNSFARPSSVGTLKSVIRSMLPILSICIETKEIFDLLI
jgi:hypothetical protein